LPIYGHYNHLHETEVQSKASFRVSLCRCRELLRSILKGDSKGEPGDSAHMYWVDFSTGLMWTAKDNGKDVSWRQATKYCRDLRLAGFSDWRLATIDELAGIYDGTGLDAPPPREGIKWALAGKPKGSLFLTGNHHWSSTKALDDRGHPRA
jgi:hypothetical protein